MELSLKKNQIDMWQTSVSLFQSNNAIDELTGLLTDEDIAHIELIRRYSEKQVKIVSRAFLRAVLAKYTGQSPKSIQFARGLHGKPKLANADMQFEFNLSHSDDLLACAVSLDQPVGIDVERIRYKRNLKHLGKSVFSPSEQCEFEQLSEQHQELYFFDRWTLKESLIKATGKGLTTKLSKVSFGKRDAIASFSVSGQQLVEVSGEYASWLWPISTEHRLAVTMLARASIAEPVTFRSFNFLPKRVAASAAA
ncbi:MULTISPECIES: 4'-phosphopantetheinyl transferase superfamily protein [Pseudoalteromonas]|uniref:4'-phosphopantetheinyl transferase family protein n=1 Tax=Pseudoalteromonas TaxID=53246 RepID=UPI00029AB10A|nr:MULTISPECIES: 4'-phosphopantetheinyl transferase superfamily protein [Pseudoalteromonas]MBR8845634.1 4'-phosphopantetheinyl transferase superfamily protein [Pseudoalteromonas sp. JC3]QUI72628.1 4'-phosphopantetheinyl transferase superfamily protein [Pseudoalteromonas sp. M8]UDM60024.1 4'-phosphopantetheinyl transferase superfamily protein [Pseudoalteromonas piscicida]WJE08843.1 4'-phosphopantetheinyl transferase superfamily protein [Pseudoalteromonas sp. JC3]